MKSKRAKVLLYWDIGQIILARQGEEGWGTSKSCNGSLHDCPGHNLTA